MTLNRSLFIERNNVNANSIFAAMFTVRVRSRSLTTLTLSIVCNSALSFDGRRGAARRDSPHGSLCVRAFPNLLGIRVTDSMETEGNCEFCALNAPQGLPRYQVLLFPLWTASELLRIKGRSTSREINHAFDLNWTLTY